MSWFDTAGIASFAKSALTTAQKTIDKALDIQEEKISRLGKQTSSKPDTEGFFEAFGLDDKPTTSTDKPKSSIVINAKPSQDVNSDNTHHHIATNPSGFWSDTWGSFFENKIEENENVSSKSKTSVEQNKIPDKSQRNDGAVLSQPQKASLFPGDSSELHTSTEVVKDVSDSQESLSSSKECSHGDVQSSQLPHFNELHFTQFSSNTERPETKSVSSKETIHSVSSSAVAEICQENVTEPPDNSEKTVIVVTEQPSGESLLNLKELKDSSNQTSVQNSQTDTISFSSEVTVNKNIETINLSSEVTVNKNIETSNCDTFIDNFQKDNVNASVNVDISNVPAVKLPSHESPDKQMEESEFFSLQLPLADEKTNDRTESEYDVIELIQSNSLKECDSKKEESSQPHSTQTVSSMYDPSGSTLVIPDLPVTVPENIANWECCALDSLSPDLFIAEENINSESNRESNANLTLPFSGSESSLRTISTDSFKDNGTWISNNKMHHFIDSSQNSSNGERNSHHSDGSSNSSKDDDDTDTAEVKEFDAKSSSSSGSHTTSSSFVKCSVDDTNSTRGHSPTSTIASERSDATKQESEQTTSGDENETATSSDIEILSPPNGENGERNASPLKHIWLPRPLRFRRSESPTSDSSKDSMMPVVSELDEVCYADEPSSPSGLYVDKDDNHQCHKNCGENENLCQLLQKQEELQNLLEAREKKLVELSKENIELQENEQRLKNLMQKMRIEQAKESRDITALTREFTQRLSQVEGQLKDAIKERDAVKIQLEEIKQELCNKIPAADVEEIIREKDQQIKELTEEGQKLSKKELQHTTIIKKLRAKQEEMTKTLNFQKEELSDNTKEVERLRKSISAKEEQEKKHIDAIRDFSTSVKKLEKEVSSLKSDLEDSREKELSFKKSLDGTYKDLTELRKSYAAKEVEVQELKSNLELQAKENLQQMLENAKKEAAREKESLILQMQELRNTLSRTEEDANLREKMFKAEIASLQKRLQEAEERNEDLTKNMSSATRPLVRQIENLQATFTTQTISWEKIEKNLTDRLSDAQNQVALLSEKERAAAEKYSECQSKLIALESQNSSLRKEKTQLTSELESLKTNVAMLEENKNRENYTLEKLKQNFNTEIKKLKQEKVNLENTMATCLEQLDVEKRKIAKLEEEIKIKDARAMIMSNVSPCPSPTGSVRSSISSIHNWSQDESHDPGIHTPVNSYRMSVYESLRLGSGSSLLENLQSQLKQREGEIFQLQSEIVKLEQVKECMTRELVQLSEQNEELDKKLVNLETLEKEHKDLDQKYNTLLQMYGEKIEETEELQLDLADVKSMYKAQIEELLMNK